MAATKRSTSGGSQKERTSGGSARKSQNSSSQRSRNSAARRSQRSSSRKSSGESSRKSQNGSARKAGGKQQPGGIRGAVASGAAEWSIDPPDAALMHRQRHFWNFLMDHYFRMEFDGWHRLPDEPCLLIGNHSGGSLTMDAWTVGLQWWRHFGEERVLHGTAHDVLRAAPGLGDYFKRMAVIPPSRKAMGAALEAGHDVVLWPGGEEDSFRPWSERDRAHLGDRTGFVKFAIGAGVPIVPVATVGGHDTVFVLHQARGLARLLKLRERLRGDMVPIVLGFPFGITPELLPVHVPLPAKIRTELLEPIRLDTDPERIEDEAYLNRSYREIEGAVQAGMDRLAARRSFPIFG